MPLFSSLIIRLLSMGEYSNLAEGSLTAILNIEDAVLINILSAEYLSLVTSGVNDREYQTANLFLYLDNITFYIL